MKYSSVIIYQSVCLESPMCVWCENQVLPTGSRLEYLVLCVLPGIERQSLGGGPWLWHSHSHSSLSFETLQAGLVFPVSSEMLSMCFSTPGQPHSCCHEEVTGNQGKSYTHFRTYSFPKWVFVLNLATDIIRQIYMITVDLQIFLCTDLATMRKIKNIKQHQVEQEGWLRPQECLPSDVLTVKQTTHNTTDFSSGFHINKPAKNNLW